MNESESAEAGLWLLLYLLFSIIRFLIDLYYDLIANPIAIVPALIILLIAIFFLFSALKKHKERKADLELEAYREEFRRNPFWYQKDKD